MLMVKDLINDLEKGNKTEEHIKNRLIVKKKITPMFPMGMAITSGVNLASQWTTLLGTITGGTGGGF